MGLQQPTTGTRLSLSKKATSQNIHGTPKSSYGPITPAQKAKVITSQIGLGLKKAYEDNHIDTYESVIDSLQVPLRVPLDLSYSQGNRQLAKVIFKTECVQKVKEATIKREMDIEHTKAQIIAKTNKDEKRYAKELKDRDTLLKQKKGEWEVKRMMVVNAKKHLNQSKNQELLDRYEEMVAADEKLKKEREKKKKEHEEELFQLDLQRVYDAEYAQGEIKEKKLQDKREVENKIKNFEEKQQKNHEFRIRTIEEEKKKYGQKNKEWEEKHFVAVNKDHLISPEDFNTYVPKKRQKSSMVGDNTKGVLVQKPEHLSTFTVDRDKI